jgi:hypothetical protein
VWPARGLNNFISAALILRLCEAVKVQFSDQYKSDLVTNQSKLNIQCFCDIKLNLVLTSLLFVNLVIKFICPVFY